MSHDCHQLRPQLDTLPLLTAEQRARTIEVAATCESCSTALASARRLENALESGRRQYQELCYRGSSPDFGAALDASETENQPIWRRRTAKWVLPLAALLLAALGLRMVWMSATLRQDIASDRELSAVAASAGAGLLVLAPPPAPPSPATVSLSSLAAGQLRRPTPPSGGKSLTFSSPPRPSSPAERHAEAEKSSATDHRQGDPS